MTQQELRHPSQYTSILQTDEEKHKVDPLFQSLENNNNPQLRQQQHVNTSQLAAITQEYRAQFAVHNAHSGEHQTIKHQNTLLSILRYTTLHYNHYNYTTLLSDNDTPLHSSPLLSTPAIPLHSSLHSPLHSTTGARQHNLNLSRHDFGELHGAREMPHRQQLAHQTAHHQLRVLEVVERLL
jgi:hypothetical protein